MITLIICFTFTVWFHALTHTVIFNSNQCTVFRGYYFSLSDVLLEISETVLLQYIIGHIWEVGRYQSEASNRRTKNTMTKGKRTKGQAMLYKILRRKLWIEQHEHNSMPRVNSGATKEEAVPTPLVPPVMWLIFSISHEESESLPKLWLNFITWKPWFMLPLY